MRTTFRALLLSALLASPALAEEYYLAPAQDSVNPGVDDSGCGDTPTNACATCQYLVDTRDLGDSDDIVNVRAGWYYTPMSAGGASCLIGSTDGGTAEDNRVTWRGVGGKAIFTAIDATPAGLLLPDDDNSDSDGGWQRLDSGTYPYVWSRTKDLAGRTIRQVVQRNTRGFRVDHRLTNTAGACGATGFYAAYDVTWPPPLSSCNAGGPIMSEGDNFGMFSSPIDCVNKVSGSWALISGVLYVHTYENDQTIADLQSRDIETTHVGDTNSNGTVVSNAPFTTFQDIVFEYGGTASLRLLADRNSLVRVETRGGTLATVDVDHVDFDGVSAHDVHVLEEISYELESATPGVCDCEFPTISSAAPYRACGWTATSGGNVVSMQATPGNTSRGHRLRNSDFYRGWNVFQSDNLSDSWFDSMLVKDSPNHTFYVKGDAPLGRCNNIRITRSMAFNGQDGLVLAGPDSGAAGCDNVTLLFNALNPDMYDTARFSGTNFTVYGQLFSGGLSVNSTLAAPTLRSDFNWMNNDNNPDVSQERHCYDARNGGSTTREQCVEGWSTSTPGSWDENSVFGPGTGSSVGDTNVDVAGFATWPPSGRCANTAAAPCTTDAGCPGSVCRIKGGDQGIHTATWVRSMFYPLATSNLIDVIPAGTIDYDGDGDLDPCTADYGCYGSGFDIGIKDYATPPGDPGEPGGPRLPQVTVVGVGPCSSNQCQIDYRTGDMPTDDLPFDAEIPTFEADVRVWLFDGGDGCGADKDAEFAAADSLDTFAVTANTSGKFVAEGLDPEATLCFGIQVARSDDPGDIVSVLDDSTVQSESTLGAGEEVDCSDNGDAFWAAVDDACDGSRDETPGAGTERIACAQAGQDLVWKLNRCSVTTARTCAQDDDCAESHSPAGTGTAAGPVVADISAITFVPSSNVFLAVKQQNTVYVIDAADLSVDATRTIDCGSDLESIAMVDPYNARGFGDVVMVHDEAAHTVCEFSVSGLLDGSDLTYATRWDVDGILDTVDANNEGLVFIPGDAACASSKHGGCFVFNLAQNSRTLERFQIDGSNVLTKIGSSFTLDSLCGASGDTADLQFDFLLGHLYQVNDTANSVCIVNSAMDELVGTFAFSSVAGDSSTDFEGMTWGAGKFVLADDSGDQNGGTPYWADDPGSETCVPFREVPAVCVNGVTPVVLDLDFSGNRIFAKSFAGTAVPYWKASPSLCPSTSNGLCHPTGNDTYPNAAQEDEGGTRIGVIRSDDHVIENGASEGLSDNWIFDGRSATDGVANVEIKDWVARFAGDDCYTNEAGAGAQDGKTGNKFTRATCRDTGDKGFQLFGLATTAASHGADKIDVIVSGSKCINCGTAFRMAGGARISIDGTEVKREAPFYFSQPNYGIRADANNTYIALAEVLISGAKTGILVAEGAHVYGTGVRVQDSTRVGLDASGTAAESRFLFENSTIARNGGTSSSVTHYGGVSVSGSATGCLGPCAVLLDKTASAAGGTSKTGVGLNHWTDNVAPGGSLRDIENQTASMLNAARGCWDLYDRSPLPQVLGPVTTDPVSAACGGPAAGGSNPISTTGRVHLNRRAPDGAQQVWAENGTSGTDRCDEFDLVCDDDDQPATFGATCATSTGERLVACVEAP